MVAQVQLSTFWFCWLSMCGLLVVQWADVLALSGDSADNIPGVKGVGIKTAPNLVRAHGDIEGVLAAAPNEKKKVAIVLCFSPLLQLDGQTVASHCACLCCCTHTVGNV